MKLNDWVNEQRGRSLALAQAIGVSPPMVSDWATGKKEVPALRCFPIEQATGGVVTRCELRPNDWQSIWPELAQSPTPLNIEASEQERRALQSRRESQTRRVTDVVVGGV